MRYYLLVISFLFFTDFGFAQISDFKSVDFTKASLVAKLNHGEALNNLPLLAYKLTSKLDTDVEKFRAIYLWVCKNISVDASQGDYIIKKRKKLKNDSTALIAWNRTYKKTTFKRLLKQKKTICTGYAYLIKELCFLAYIDCKIIDGYARDSNSNVENLDFVNHSWNAVKLNNKWYLCDATWASGYTFNGKFIKDYNDGYFLTEPLLFAKNHYPIKKKWLLNDSLINTEFSVSPMVYGNTFKHRILPVLPNQLYSEVKKQTPIYFKFKVLDSNLESRKIELVKVQGINEYHHNITNLQFNDYTVSFLTQFKHKGYYDLHLKISGDIVASYTFKVIK